MRYINSIQNVIAFGRIDEIKSGITPQKWLQSHWHIRIGDYVIAEPSSSFFVFLLAFVIMGLAFYMFKTKKHQRSRMLLGYSMFLWALSTFSAGISYQIFSYELKCVGQIECLWTTPWEILYLILYVISVKLLVLAISFSCANTTLRRYFRLYAIIMGVVYSFMLIIGIFTPNQFLISFELMVLFLAPSYILMFVLNLRNYMSTKSQLDIHLIYAWIGMLLITISYFGFYYLKVADTLWQNGIWFNANDVLHLLLIVWVVYFRYGVCDLIKDRE